MSPVLQDLEIRGWLNKVRTTSKGAVRGGRPFDKSSLYSLLTNPIYVGKIRHKSALYAGEHEPIIKPEVFEAVQSRLRKNGRNGGSDVRSRHNTLLRGLLYCKACGRVMVHTFTDKGAKRYRYYTCTLAIKSGRGKCLSGSLPAAEIERLVVAQVQRISSDADLRAEVLRQAQAHVEADFTARTQEQRSLQRRHSVADRISDHGGRGTGWLSALRLGRGAAGTHVARGCLLCACNSNMKHPHRLVAFFARVSIGALSPPASEAVMQPDEVQRLVENEYARTSIRVKARQLCRRKDFGRSIDG